jgi:hypothetical protein
MWRVLFVLLCFPLTLQAAALRIVPDSLPVLVGSPVSFVIEADTQGKAVNAVETSFIYDEAFFQFEGAQDAESRILFWVSGPRVCGAGRVCFSGITPGGFSGNSQEIVSLTFTPTRAGTTTLSLLVPRLLQHDGKGTDLAVESESIQIVVEETQGNADVSVRDRVDTEPPEVFTPQVITDPQLYDGRSVLIFDTKDKQTVVVAYFVREFSHPWLAWLSDWKLAESPYLLTDQSLSSYIEVKAVDSAGNERKMTVLPQVAESFLWRFFGLVLGIIALFIGIVTYFSVRKTWVF